jgi:hypothetical protein
MKLIRKSGPIQHPRQPDPIWYLTFDRMDYIEFRQWADHNGIRYRFTSESVRVMMFSETDAMLCYLSFV